MKPSPHIIFAAFAAAAGCAVSASAQAPPAKAPTTPDRLEVTMTLLPENAKDGREITRKIELPPAVAPTKPSDGKQSGSPAAAGQGNGSDGLEKAAEARERGREFGQDVADQARDNREKATRGKDSPNPPVDRPVGPGNGGPPDNTPGRGKP